MNCENCKHFQLIDDPEEEWGIENRPGFGSCDSEKFVYYGREDQVLPPDALGYSDFEQYRAFIRVGPKFGCIHFEAK